MPVPTPKDLAARPRTSLPAAPPAASPAAPSPVERYAHPLEHYVHLVRRSGLNPRTVALACALADYADPDTLRLGSATPDNPTLARALGLNPRWCAATCRLRLTGWISRPAPQEGVTAVRPVTLTFPGTAAAAAPGPS